MKTSQLSMAAVLLVAGCAHNQATHGARAEADTSKAGDVEHGEPGAVHDEQTGERVDVPRSKQRGHLAPNGDELPADRKSEKPADNTAVNERDRESSALTPLDQSEEEGDRDLTQSIRKAVIADSSLSFTAKNVKIITRDGRVTLRGSVNNAGEKDTIERAAREIAGAKQVTSELEVSE